VDFRILGPLQVLDEGRDVTPRRAKQRALLAALLLHGNELISADRLIDQVWGDEPPPTAGKALQGHVSALRKLVGTTRIETESGGYRLGVHVGELDVDRFDSAVRAAKAVADPADRARRLREALAGWRGAPLADLGDEPFVQSDVARIDALRLAALEELVDAELALGHHVEYLPELERLVREHPLREVVRGQLMLALYRGGRQSEALQLFAEGRRLLADELGIEPGAQLRALERRIREQDPALDLPNVVEGTPRQERKVVTVLVADVRPAGSADPEDLARIAGPVLERMRSVIERFGGTAEELFANAVVGVFGAPRAHDDDTERAVRAALELRSLDGARPIEVRIGIDRGEALVTIERGVVSIAGDVLAAASRLQATARPGAIAVGDTAHRSTAAAFDYEEAGPGAWSAVAPRSVPTAAAIEGPFVGRRRELGLLERAFDRARSDRSVQLVTIVAEPGGGKTRLIGELRAALEASGDAFVWRQGRCLPYGEGVAYWALGEIVRAHAGILESDRSDTSAAKLAAAVAALEPDESRRAWLDRGLAALVGIEGATAAGDRQQAFAVWRQFLEAVASREPLVVVFEDVHWADAGLLEFIEHLVGHATGVPVLVLATARLELLETRPGWGGGARNAETIALEPLSSADTEALMGSLLGRAPAPATIKRASGNPLFAHELARMIEQSQSEASGVIPESLQAIIAARLDALAPDIKALAADAAVVGEVFWSGAVASMGGLDDREAESRLQRLVANDVARRRRSSSVARQSEYAFLHALVRDVAYWQIPRRERIARHRAAGEWIERLAGDRLTSHAELIAHHFLEALELAQGVGDEQSAIDLRPRAQTFLTLAGDGARALDTSQAESFYRRALDLTDEDGPAHGRLLFRLGEVAQLTGRLAEAEQLSRDAIAELTAHDDLRGAGEAMGTLLATLWRLGRPEALRYRLAAKAIRTLEQLPPGPELVLAYSHMATHELHAGRATACGEWSRRALDLAGQLDLVALQVPPLHHLGIARFESGDETGIDDIREAVRIGLEVGLSSETAIAQSNLAATIWVTEGPVAALAIKRAAAEFALSRGLLSLETTIRAESLWQQFDAGAWDDALASADRLLAEEGDAGPNRITTMAQTVRARILVERGRTEDAGGLAQQFLARARALGDPQDLGPALAAGAALQSAQGDVDGAAALIDELERVTRGRDPSQRVHELPLAARVCRAAGTIAVTEALIPTRGAPTYTRARLCLASANAEVAETRGQPRKAVELHAVAAAGWQAFGCPLEEAHARLGMARCLLALDRAAEAVEAARDADRIGRQLGARQVTAEAERLVA
jgi:DNA-binding SARP family transcriptional activator